LRKELTSREWWSQAWHYHHRAYVARTSLQAYYLNCILPRHTQVLLELGAGSFRDTAQLNQWGYTCYGTDFSPDAVMLGRQTFPQYAHRFVVADSTRLPFKEKTCDVCFHNGLFVYFEEDAIIREILSEQVRISRVGIVCTVHNALNARLLQRFEMLAKDDPLYEIRFFTPDELVSLLTPYCSAVSVYPYGNLFCNRLAKYSRNRHLVRLFYRLTYRHWDWTKCERIMAVGWLQ
jgi:hypothetical protein